MGEVLTAAAIQEAAKVLKTVVTHTPLQYDAYLSQKYHCQVYLKREDLQKVRSFKLRGAYYAIQQTTPAVLAKGVVCASAGNHAQGVAYACQEKQVPATIFMPTTTPNQKIAQVKFFGGEQVTIRLIGDTFDESAAAAKDFAQAEGLKFIAPFDDAQVIAGQGTVAVEIFADLKQQKLQADYLFGAIGGGGLMSGVAAYAKAVSPQTAVIGVEPQGAASMAAALDAGVPVALAELDKFVDGASVREVGALTLAHCQRLLDHVWSVEEGYICSTILELYTKQAIVVEPAGALSIAALEQARATIQGKTVVCIVSGGNNDISRMQEIEERALLFEGLQHYFIVQFPQRAGALKEFVTDILGPNDDITKFEYTKKINRGSGPVVIGVQLKQPSDSEPLMDRIAEFDPQFIHLNHHPSLFTLFV